MGGGGVLGRCRARIIGMMYGEERRKRVGEEVNGGGKGGVETKGGVRRGAGKVGGGEAGGRGIE